MNRLLQDILEQPQTLRLVLESLSKVEKDSLAHAAHLIRNASRVVLTSMGNTFHACMPVAVSLARVHRNVQLIETAELLREDPHPDSLYVILSRSGESHEITEFAQGIGERGGKLIAITMTPQSTLAKLADVVILDEATYDGLICTKAHTSLAFCGLMLVEHLAGTWDAELDEQLKALFDWMERGKVHLVGQVSQLAALTPDRGITFLSHGTAMGLAMTGALWVEETARVRASAESIGLFRHGPIEQVDDDFCGMWIDLCPTPRTRQLRQELLGRGGQVITVGLPGEATNTFDIPAGDLPEPFRWLGAAMIVQLAAHRIAVLRGIDPGKMRYLEWLVK